MVVDYLKNRITENGIECTRAQVSSFFNILHCQVSKNNSDLSLILTIKYLKMMNEIKAIIYRCGLERIQVTFLKGLFEAYDLYERPEDRDVGDIDILINKKDVFRIIDVLYSLNYIPDVDLRDEAISQKAINDREAHHLCAFRKSFFESSMPIVIEVHYLLDVAWHDKNELSNVILKESQLGHIDGCPIPVPCIEDRLIIAMQHFSRHLLADITGYADGAAARTFDCKTLYDACLIYKKYTKQIDFDKLYRKADLYGFCDYLLVANKMIKTLFAVSVLDESVLLKIHNTHYNHWRNVINEAIYNSITENNILSLDYSIFYKSVIDECLKHNIHYICKNNFENEICLFPNIGSITKSRFGTVFRELNTSLDHYCFGACIKMKWDDEFLYMIVDVYDTKVKCFGPKENNAWSDGINISFYNPTFCFSKNNVLKTFLICPARTEEKMDVYVETNIHKKGLPLNLSKSAHAFTCELTETGYRTSIKFNWKELEVNVKKDLWIGMDIAINDVNSDLPLIDSCICWSNPTKSYYCPAKFGRIVFSSSY